jgi:tetratricopeptide (TPR) repeat protein
LLLLAILVYVDFHPITGYAAEGQKPSGKDEIEWAKGFDLYKQRRYAEAIERFNVSLTYNPKYFRSLNGKGICMAFMGNPQEGLKYINRALSINPKYENGYFNKALAQELSGSWADAIKSYDKALAIVSTNPWSYYGKACSYGMLGDAEHSAECLRKAITIDPSIRQHAATEKDLVKVRSDPRMVKVLSKK